MASMRARASVSASTSYSTNSRSFQSSHSRNSRVYGQLDDPKSSSFATGDHLQSFAQEVVGGGLHFLNARNVIGADNQRKIRQPAPQDLSSVVAQQRHGQHPALTRLLQRQNDVARSTAGGNTNRHIFRTGL